MQVTKRDGRKVPFNLNKIEVAITKAFYQGNYTEDSGIHPVATDIALKIQALGKDMTVEGIQDLVEKELMKVEPDVAKAYILYRDQRTKTREKKSRIIEAMRRRLNAVAVQNANANVDERSFSGREKEASADIQKVYALEDTLSKDVSDAHRNMWLYQHDLEKAPIGEHNCLNIDFGKIFKEGFSTRNGDIRPPASFSTACQQMAVIFQCQSQVQFGGVGTVHVDYDLAPFVKMSFYKHWQDGIKYIGQISIPDDVDVFQGAPDMSIEDYPKDSFNERNIYRYAMDMLEKEMKQSAEALYHNLNTLESRAGSQVPFTSINFGRDTSPEGRMVSRAMLNASLAGIGKHHRTSIFPISIFQYKKGCNAKLNDPNYDLSELAVESLSKRIYPNFCNCDWSQAHEDENDPDTYFSTMGKRKLQLM